MKTIAMAMRNLMLAAAAALAVSACGAGGGDTSTAAALTTGGGTTTPPSGGGTTTPPGGGTTTPPGGGTTTPPGGGTTTPPGGGTTTPPGGGTTTPPPTTPPTSVADFTTRCSQPGVLRCVGFDAPADISGRYGNNTGILSGMTTPALDTTVKASGASSLKFTILSNSPADTSGSFFANFSTDLATQFAEDGEFFIQWRQRFSPEFINTFYNGGEGWKQAIISAGDKPGCTASNTSNCQSSCTALETVVQNTFQRKFPQMYNSCDGSASHGPFDPFEQPFGSADFKLQNARLTPFCLYSQVQSSNPAARFPPAGNCFGYFPDEWMTFQVRIKTGPLRVGDEWPNSFVTLWIAREGQPSQAAIAWGPYSLSAGSAAANLKFGKIWLLPYHTKKDPTQAHATAFTWYDELIISRTQIPDPQ